MKSIVAILLACLAGSVLASDITAVGTDAYAAAREVGTADIGGERAKAVLRAEAAEFCGEKGLVPRVRETQHTERDGAARVKIEFQCITKDSRPPLSSFQR